MIRETGVAGVSYIPLFSQRVKILSTEPHYFRTARVTLTVVSLWTIRTGFISRNLYAAFHTLGTRIFSSTHSIVCGESATQTRFALTNMSNTTVKR
jgi:hypothetical protein